MRVRRKVRTSIAVLTFVALLSGGLLARRSLWAMFVGGDEAPVERLVANITEQIKKTPNDPNALYLLGRVNALAYSAKSRTLYAFNFAQQKEGLPQLDERSGKAGKDADPQALKQYLHDAVTNYRAALTLSPRTALYHLSLASVIETAGGELGDSSVDPEIALVYYKTINEPEQQDIISRVEKGELYDGQALIDSGAYATPLLRKLLKHEKKEVVAFARETLTAIWREEAIYHYWMAYMLSIKQDMAEREKYSLRSPIGEEAASAYVKLVNQRGPTDQEKVRLTQIDKDLKTLSHRSRAETPIIFSEREHATLDTLLSGKRVHFDLDGDDVVEECPWVSADTSILVWDPQHRGRITSGRQLFGAVTWWIFWDDGYHALEALDDNHDGVLSGAELHGLAVWRDANENGIADPGEVTPIEDTGIESIAVHSTAVVNPGPSPANLAGIRMKDGRVLATFDWTIAEKEVKQPGE